MRKILPILIKYPSQILMSKMAISVRVKVIIHETAVEKRQMKRQEVQIQIILE